MLRSSHALGRSLFLSFVVVVSSRAVRAQAPVSWYSFDVPDQPGKDVAGTNDGMPVGDVAQVPGKVGSAASFSNGYILLPASPSLNLRSGSFTLSAWVKGDFNANNRNWFTKATTSTHVYGIAAGNLGNPDGYQGRVHLSFDGGPGGGSWFSTTIVFDGTWHHVTAVKRGDVPEIWVDGRLENSAGIGNVTGTSEDGQFAIGADGLCCEPFNGLIDEAKIWNRALSPAEIAIEASSETCVTQSSIAANFNGTSIPAGSFIWFNSVASVKGRDVTKTTIVRMVDGMISYSALGTVHEVPVPDTIITFSPAAAAASTAVLPDGSWSVTVPAAYTGNVFRSGVPLPLSTGLPGGIKNVTWSGTIGADTGLTIEWKWAAAAYSLFSTDGATLAVKPIDGSSSNPYQNSDHAGTPEGSAPNGSSFKSFVIGGATGGGGANATGSYSGTGKVVCP